MIRTSMSREELDAALQEIAQKIEIAPVSEDTVRSKVRHIENFDDASFRNLLAHVADGTFDYPSGWLHAIQRLDAAQQIELQAPSPPPAGARPLPAGPAKRRRFPFNQAIAYIGLVFSLLAIAVPLYVDYLKSRRQLEIQFLSQVEMVSPQNKIAGMKVFFKDRQVNGLSRLTYRLVNSGRSEILTEDVKIFPTLTFGRAKVIATSIDRLKPRFLADEVSLGVDEPTSSVVLRFGELKPEESILFSVFVDGEVAHPLSAHARIRGVQELVRVDLFERVREQEGGQGFVERNRWLIWLVWPLTLFNTVVLLYGGHTLRSKRRMRNRLKQGLKLENLSPPELNAFMREHLGYMTDDKKLKLHRDAQERPSEAVNAIYLEIFDRSDAIALVLFLSMLAATLWYLAAYYKIL